MWKKILEFKNFNDKKMFPNLVISRGSPFFSTFKCKSQTNFSIVNDIKNKKRNRLSNETVSAICTIRSSFQAKGINCINFDEDSEHLKLHNPHNLYAKPGNSCDG